MNYGTYFDKFFIINLSYDSIVFRRANKEEMFRA